MNNKLPEKSKEPLFQRVVSILEEARSKVVRTVNSEMVIAYWLIGREIVEEEQQGEEKAEYGKHLIENLSQKLTEQFGKGYSVPNLRNFRQFYLTFMQRQPEIQYPLGSESNSGFSPGLGWSHYRALMRVDNDHARSFYEVEAIKNQWSKRDLERQIHSLLFERLLKSTDKKGLLELANEGHVVDRPVDVIKDPYVLEFLDLPESSKLSESKIETALLNHLQEFLLELGTGFAFIGRQKRITLEGDHFYPDLVFYHVKLKCYVVVDLKTTKLDHGDLGQMQLYVNYYDREIRTEEDNPTIGLILCTSKNDSVVRYILDEKNQQIFASRYRLELPSEDELKRELEYEQRLVENIKDKIV
ncbi:MAG: PDDEXK nuclease domain-containing protein [Candidatus Caenarcaniphilales bacterium]|nr:PDDEXK nuclease domain-containing protein [Candidatus Caenarcaniphilales bacterium]